MTSAFEKHGISHLSASSINLFIAQPAMWCVSYLMKRRTPVGPAAHRGTAIEAGIEAGLFDPQMPVEECQRIAQEKFHSLTRLSADNRIDKERATIDGSVEVGLRELRQYGVPEAPEGDRQHKVVRMIEGVPIPIWGYLDFWWPQHGVIVDLKTTSRVPSSVSDAHARQGAFYAGANSNQQVRMAYLSEKKIAVYVVEEVGKHLHTFVTAAQAIERLLSLSDDSEKLTRCFVPDLSTFYWSDAAARSVADEIWGPSPNDAAPVVSALINE